MSLFDFNNRGERGRIEENTELRELDEFGQPRQPRQSTDTPRGGGLSGRVGGGLASKKGVIAGVLVIGLILFIFATGNGANVIDMFSSTPSENMDAMFNEIRNVEKINHKEGQLDPVYDHNTIYASSKLFSQVEKQYVVYLYTGDGAVDEPFNQWVLDNKESIPIYTFNTFENEDKELYNIVGTDPAFVIIFEQEKDFKVMDSVVLDPQTFETIPTILNTIKEYRQTKDKK